MKTSTVDIKGVSLRLYFEAVRECRIYSGEVGLVNSGIVAGYYRRLQESQKIPTEREAFVVFLLTTHYHVIGAHVVSVGTLDSSLVHPREVFRLAIAAGASAIIVAHHHPSGSAMPSAEDRLVTERLRQAGEILGVALLDHLVIGSEDFVSIMEGAK